MSMPREPEDNQPGHHPEHEQDKPSGDAFVQKLHEHAREVDAAVEADEAKAEAGAEPEPTLAGDALRAAAAAVRTVRENLPGA